MGGELPHDQDAAAVAVQTALDKTIEKNRCERIALRRRMLRADGLGKSAAAWFRDGVSSWFRDGVSYYNNVAVQAHAIKYFDQDAVDKVREYYDDHFTQCASGSDMDVYWALYGEYMNRPGATCRRSRIPRNIYDGM
ncbi:unnamed protein product [Prorocentrum cordatum]|uniref:Phospholipase B-like n=1 Tax=Prorocentrum cordatum TaxID=2364126 RepID=A0ABN9VBV2_9DINO|nr:unnamed protein product [Polarella glacialis]